MSEQRPDPEQNNRDTRSELRRLIIALLFLLISFICVFCSSYSAIYFIDRDKISGGIRARIQADYGPGVEISLAPIDRDRIIAEIMQDERDLLATPEAANAAAVIVALLPKITPVQLSPTPTAGTAEPTAVARANASPTAETTGEPATSTAPPTATSGSVEPSPTVAVPTTTPSATLPPATATSTQLPPTATPTVNTPTATATSVPPTATSTPTSPPTSSPPTSTNTPVSPPANDPPTANNDTATVTEDDFVVIDVLTNDTDLDGTIVAGTLAITVDPSHGVAVANTSTGEITYTPDANYAGPDSLVYRVCDNSGDCDTATVSITVSPLNDPPVAVPDTASTAEDTSKVIDVLNNDFDVDNDPLTVVSVTTPISGSTSTNGSTVTYTPTLNFNGTDIFGYTISDGVLTDSTVVTVTVTPVNDPPVAVPDTASTAEDTSEVIDVLGNDFDVDGDRLTVVSVTPPTNGSTSTNGRTVTYVPKPDSNGDVFFDYTISDGFLTDSTTVTVTIIAINDPPVAAPDSYTTPVNTMLTVPAPGVLANDTDVDSPSLRAILVSGPNPAGGSFSFNQNGGFSYTPPLNFTGVVTFTYKANDGSGGASGADSNTVTVTITVN